MGTDDLHKKRKARTVLSLQRRNPKREPRKVILIVCEGKKSEPIYLCDLRNELKLNRQTVHIEGTGFDPKRLLNYALRKNIEHGGFDKVFCVFDHDDHPHYAHAIDTIKSKQSIIPMEAITSVPCFEFWLLLHYEEKSKPYHKKGNKSASDQVISDLKKHIKDYKKGHFSIYEQTKSKQGIAIKRAKSMYKQQLNNGTENPSTKFHLLVEYLQNMVKDSHIL